VRVSRVEKPFDPPPESGDYTQKLIGELLQYSDEKIREPQAEKSIGVFRRNESGN